jgi:hypothetical protein
MTNPIAGLSPLPPRFKPPSVARGIALLFLAALLTLSVVQVEFSLAKLGMGLPNMARIIAEMFPLDLLRLRSVGRRSCPDPRRRYEPSAPVARILSSARSCQALSLPLSILRFSAWRRRRALP